MLSSGLARQARLLLLGVRELGAGATLSVAVPGHASPDIVVGVQR